MTGASSLWALLEEKASAWPGAITPLSEHPLRNLPLLLLWFIRVAL